MKKCPVCNRPVEEWPLCFRGDWTCSVVCQKALEQGDSAPPAKSEPSCE